MDAVGDSCVLLVLVVIIFSQSSPFVQCKQCPRMVFNFGDSNSDTGGAPAGYGYVVAQPEGRVFFKQPAGRVCDGRLIIDFMCESLNSSYLSPYLESLGSNYRHGANFAIAGAKTLPINENFALRIQVGQFRHFKERSLELITQGAKGLISKEGFRRAIYTIDIGQNDLAIASGYLNNSDQVIEKIPTFIEEIKIAMQTIYDNGGRNFWLHNTGPIGCLPQKLALPRRENDSIDSYGCLIQFNGAAMEFNKQLSSLCDSFRAKWQDDAVVVYTDVFAIKYDLITNYSLYGFQQSLMACCGNGGPPYNYDPNIQCGNPKCPVCADGTKFISWDGIHYTEAANKLIAAKIISAEHSTPKLKFSSFCRGK